MRGFNYKKSVQALNFIASRNGNSENKMKAIKLIWLADRFHLRKYGRSITGDIYFALPHGPVPSTTRDILELNSFSLNDDELNYSNEYLSITGKYDYKTIKTPYLKVFSKTDVEALEKVFGEYGKNNQYALRDISHEFPEWKKFKNSLDKRIGSRFLMNYTDFFENPEIPKPLFNEQQDELELVKKLFLKEE